MKMNVLFLIFLCFISSCKSEDPLDKKRYKDIVLHELGQFPDMTKKLAFEVADCVIEQTGDLSVGEIKEKYKPKKLNVIMKGCGRTLDAMTKSLLRGEKNSHIKFVSDCLERESGSLTSWGFGKKFSSKEKQKSIFAKCIESIPTEHGKVVPTPKGYFCVCGIETDNPKKDETFEIYDNTGADWPSKTEIFKKTKVSCKAGTTMVTCIGAGQQYNAMSRATWTMIGVPSEYQP